MGLDIQVLRENAKAVSPPHHLNFLNPKSVAILLESVNFNVLEISTPGVLDFDIIKNNIDKADGKIWKNLLEYLTGTEIDQFQNFISSVGISSHMMVVCSM